MGLLNHKWGAGLASFTDPLVAEEEAFRDRLRSSLAAEMDRRSEVQKLALECDALLRRSDSCPQELTELISIVHRLLLLSSPQPRSTETV